MEIKNKFIGGGSRVPAKPTWKKKKNQQILPQRLSKEIIILMSWICYLRFCPLQKTKLTRYFKS